MHYEDNSHCWIPPWKPNPTADAGWYRQVKAHLAAHREGPRRQPKTAPKPAAKVRAA